MNCDVSGISILIPSYNTPFEYLNECIKSICNQTCINNYTFEIVWVNDGSDEQNTTELEKALEFFKPYKNIILVYKRLIINQGICDALNIGIELCSYDLIFRMDSDDIMYPTRIEKQIQFMIKNPQAMICGTQLVEYVCINNNWVRRKYQSNLPNVLSWYDFLQKPVGWFMNHPTLCYRKYAIEKIGKYSEDPIIKESKMEDFELELRFLKTFGFIYNLTDCLLIYRVYSKPKVKEYTVQVQQLRKYIINKLLML